MHSININEILAHGFGTVTRGPDYPFMLTCHAEVEVGGERRIALDIKQALCVIKKILVIPIVYLKR